MQPIFFADVSQVRPFYRDRQEFRKVDRVAVVEWRLPPFLLSKALRFRIALVRVRVYG